MKEDLFISTVNYRDISRKFTMFTISSILIGL